MTRSGGYDKEWRLCQGVEVMTTSGGYDNEWRL